MTSNLSDDAKDKKKKNKNKIEKMKKKKRYSFSFQANCKELTSKMHL